MLPILKNAENIISVTATEKATLEVFFYLFRFFLIENNKDFLIQLPRLNPTSNRYDLFTLTLPTDLDLPAGKYHYFIYQAPNDGDTDFENMLELENGKVIVPTTEMNNTDFKTNNEPDFTFNPS